MGGFHTFHSQRPYTLFANGGHVTFQAGDKVIYPNHGLGVVERIEEKTILGTTCGFYHQDRRERNNRARARQQC